MINKYKKKLIKIIHNHLPNATILVFGSRARGTHQEGSDVDLAIDFGSKINLDTILQIKQEIEETTFPYLVDIVDMHVINKNLKEEIQKDGIIWSD